ncbi:MAG: nucleotide-binding protein [Abitibacteriaceae bacterium]|nr:nucleotide-binding protein [Abditibacteriaceae bacterium]
MNKQTSSTLIEDSKKESLTGKIKSEFPKHTLEEALRVPRVLEDRNGGQPLPPMELAGTLDLSPGNRNFQMLLSSSIKYGLTKGSFNGIQVSIEDLGKRIVEAKDNSAIQEVLIAAALKPPTFQAIYDYYKGKKLPEVPLFQNAVVREFNVPKEHAAKCIEVFNANMDYVGLIHVAGVGRWLKVTPTPLRKDDSELPHDPFPLNGEFNTNGVMTANLGQDHSLNGTTTHNGVGNSGLSINNGLNENNATHLGYSNESLKQQNNTPTPANAIFVGHGKNHKPLEQLKEILSEYKLPHKVAVQEANSFRPISQKVADTMKECSAAILIFTADEEFHDAHGNSIWRPSENVVFELGAASALYGGKIIIFKEDTVHFPSNFRDIGYISFEKDALSAKVSDLFRELISFGLIKFTVGG